MTKKQKEINYGSYITNQIRMFTGSHQFDMVSQFTQDYNFSLKQYLSIVKEEMKIFKKDDGTMVITEDKYPDKELNYKYKAVPCNYFKNDGYISPKGDYFKCGQYGHKNIAPELIEIGFAKEKPDDFYGSEEDWLDILGWIKISTWELKFNWYPIMKSNRKNANRYINSNLKITQKQIDKLMDWIQKENIKSFTFNGNTYNSLQELLEDEYQQKYFN